MKKTRGRKSRETVSLSKAYRNLVTKLIFVQIFFLSLFNEKINKLLDQGNISRISGRIFGIRPYGYPEGQSGVRPDTGYQKRPDIRCIPSQDG
jgi:hypothetical protein